MYDVAKKHLDFLLAFIALLLLFPLLALIAILIKLDSRGPVIFKQQRVGRRNALFTMYKFRTMKIDTPNISTELLGDPAEYLTQVGKLLRKTSLDELPQLFNILQGHMAIIGPRPALYNQYELIDMRTKEGIAQVRPGLTGYAQVKGRDLLTDSQKVNLEKYYCEHRGVLLDLKIICWTFVSVWRAEGVRMG